MTENPAARDVIYLASCAVNGQVPDRSKLENMDPDRVLAFATGHMLTAAVSFALESAGLGDGRTRDAVASSQRKAVLFRAALEGIKKELDRAGIWYMPLKGAVLQGMYPKFGMREFSDNDVLFDAARAGDVRGIMEKLGFTTEHYAVNNHDVYVKPPYLSFEMHRSLFKPAQGEELCEYYKNVEGRLAGEGCEKHFTPEDCYVYLLAHEHKHYSEEGTGLRSLLDTYVFLKNNTLDMDYVAAETEKLGLGEFERRNRSLALNLFGGGELTDEDLEMLDYFLMSGTFGTVGNKVAHKMSKEGWGRLRYALKRVAVPISPKNEEYAKAAETFPLFYKHKILLPFLPAYKVCRAIKSGRFREEAKAIKNAKNPARRK